MKAGGLIKNIGSVYIKHGIRQEKLVKKSRLGLTLIRREGANANQLFWSGFDRSMPWKWYFNEQKVNVPKNANEKAISLSLSKSNICPF